MGEYLKSVVSAVLAIGLLSVIFPKNSFGKYINLLTSIIVMAILLIPLFNMGDRLDVDFGASELEFSKNSYIMEEFEKELAKNIENELNIKTNLDFSVCVHAEKKEEVINVYEIEIFPFSKEYAKIVSDYLGIDEERITQK